MVRFNGRFRGLFILIFCVWIAESGTVYKTIMKEGKGRVPTKGQTVVVHYNGTLQSGTKFDSSHDRNEPFKFKLGAGEVIPGWDAGVSSMKVGERARLEIAPEDAYGPEGMPPVIPPSSTLIFTIELMAIEGHGASPGLHVNPGNQGKQRNNGFTSSPVQGIGGASFPNIADINQQMNRGSMNTAAPNGFIDSQPNNAFTNEQIAELQQRANQDFQRQMQNVRNLNQGISTQNPGPTTPPPVNRNGGSLIPNDLFQNQASQGFTSQLTPGNFNLPGQQTSAQSNNQGFSNLPNLPSFSRQNQPGNPSVPSFQNNPGTQLDPFGRQLDNQQSIGRDQMRNDRLQPTNTGNPQFAPQRRFGVPQTQGSDFGRSRSTMSNQLGGDQMFRAGGFRTPQDGRRMPSGPEFSTSSGRAQFDAGMTRNFADGQMTFPVDRVAIRSRETSLIPDRRSALPANRRIDASGMRGTRDGRAFMARRDLMGSSRVGIGGVPPGMRPGLIGGMVPPRMVPPGMVPIMTPFGRRMVSPFMMRRMRRRRRMMT